MFLTKLSKLTFLHQSTELSACRQTYQNWGEAVENCDYIWQEIDDDDHFHNTVNIPGTVLSAERRIDSWHENVSS